MKWFVGVLTTKICFFAYEGHYTGFSDPPNEPTLMSFPVLDGKEITSLSLDPFMAAGACLTADGELWCWGTSYANITPVPIAAAVSQVNLNNGSVCAYGSADLYCFGGALGSSPTHIAGPGGTITSVSAASSGNICVAAGGKCWCKQGGPSDPWVELQGLTPAVLDNKDVTYIFTTGGSGAVCVVASGELFCGGSGSMSNRMPSDEVGDYAAASWPLAPLNQCGYLNSVEFTNIMFGYSSTSMCAAALDGIYCYQGALGSIGPGLAKIT